jgi:hypothetical protein
MAFAGKQAELVAPQCKIRQIYAARRKNNYSETADLQGAPNLIKMN